MWNAYDRELDEAAEAALREYNPCHHPDSGRFCSARGKGMLTSILGPSAGDSDRREMLAQVARGERLQRWVERRVARAAGRPEPPPVSKSEIADEYRATRKQLAFDRVWDRDRRRVERREWRQCGDDGRICTVGHNVPASLENLYRAGRQHANRASGRGHKGIGPEFYRRAFHGGEMTQAEAEAFHARVTGRRRKRSSRTKD